MLQLSRSGSLVGFLGQPLLIRAGILVTALAVSSIFFIDFCNLVFQCGCRSLWAGAAAYCNIHNPGSRHCPWCVMDTRPAMAAIYIPQVLISLWPASWSWTKRITLALLAFPVGGGIAAGIYGWIAGYWS